MFIISMIGKNKKVQLIVVTYFIKKYNKKRKGDYHGGNVSNRFKNK